MVAEGKLAGVLTVYSSADRFTAKDVAVFEMLAALLAPVVAADARRRVESTNELPVETCLS